MRKILVAILVFSFVLVGRAWCLRIVVLYPAASPILKALGVPASWVVGVTRTDDTFPSAVKVGSHLRPNIELVKALRPQLVIAGSKRALPPSIAEELNARIFRYDPRTLKGILKKILELGKLLGKKEQAKKLVLRLKAELKKVKKLPYRPGVVYEVMSHPLIVAGRKNIVSDIIFYAGGKNLITANKKHVFISPEEVLLLRPRFYIYQVGPMNRNPVPPNKRPYYKGLKAWIIKVSEEEFARPGLNSFSAVLKLNRIFYEFIVKHKR